MIRKEMNADMTSKYRRRPVAHIPNKLTYEAENDDDALDIPMPF